MDLAETAMAIVETVMGLNKCGVWTPSPSLSQCHRLRLCIDTINCAWNLLGLENRF